MGLQERGIGKDGLPFNKPGLFTLPQDLGKQPLKHVQAPPGTGLGQHAVMGHHRIQVHPAEPQPVQAEGQMADQLAFGADILQIGDHIQFQEHHRIDRLMAAVPVAMGHQRPHAVEPEGTGQFAIQMLGRDALLDIHAHVK